MKVRCVQCSRVHDEQPAFCSCGSATFQPSMAIDPAAYLMRDELADDEPGSGGVNVGPDSSTAAAGLEVAPQVAEDAELVGSARLAHAAGGFCCSQINCDQQAGYRFTWPGKPESLACEQHALAAANTAAAMGLALQVVALRDDGVANR